MNQQVENEKNRGSKKEPVKETVAPLKINSLKQLMFDEITKKYTIDHTVLDKIKIFGKLINHKIQGNLTILTLCDETGEE